MEVKVISHIVCFILPKSSYREEVWNQFSQSPFFDAWHPKVLQLYIEHGIVQCDDSTYRLKMDPLQEALLFSETTTGSEDAWRRLRTLDESIEILWIMPGEGQKEYIRPFNH